MQFSRELSHLLIIDVVAIASFAHLVRCSTKSSLVTNAFNIFDADVLHRFELCIGLHCKSICLSQQTSSAKLILWQLRLSFFLLAFYTCLHYFGKPCSSFLDPISDLVCLKNVFELFIILAGKYLFPNPSSPHYLSEN